MPSQPLLVKQLLQFKVESYSSIQHELNQHKRWLQAIKCELPSFLSEHCIDCTKNGKSLILYTDSPVWATRLRFHQSIILASLQQSCNLSIKKIHIRIFVGAKTNRAKVRPPKYPSQNIVKLIGNTAESIHDKTLKKSLLNLTKTLSLKQSQDVSLTNQSVT